MNFRLRFRRRDGGKTLAPPTSKTDTATKHYVEADRHYRCDLAIGYPISINHPGQLLVNWPATLMLMDQDDAGENGVWLYNGPLLPLKRVRAEEQAKPEGRKEQR